MRRRLIVGNWKMHKTVAETRALLRALRACATPAEVEVVVCPPFTALYAAAEELRGSGIALCAQTMHEAAYGAFTGEVSPVMLAELGVTYVILGHSERRQHFGETDQSVARKVRSALAHGITPIVAVGETTREHADGETRSRVVKQTCAAFEGVPDHAVATCVVAYEPIWAIGTGVTDEPASADAVMHHIRHSVRGLHDARMLYGGSMKGNNTAMLLAQPNIDGGLIGGGSLTMVTFGEILNAAHALPATK